MTNTPWTPATPPTEKERQERSAIHREYEARARAEKAAKEAPAKDALFERLEKELGKPLHALWEQERKEAAPSP